MELLQQPQQQNTTQLSRELENSISKLENLLKNTSTALPTAILEGGVNEISSKLKNLKDSNTPLDDSLKKRLQDLYSNPLLKPLIEKSEFESLWPKAEKDDKKTPSSLENIRTVEAKQPLYIPSPEQPSFRSKHRIKGSFNPSVLKDPNAPLDFDDLNQSLLALASLVSGAKEDPTFFEQYLSLLNDKIKYLKDKYGNQFTQEFNSFLADLQSSVNSKDHTRFSTLAEQLKKDSYFKNLEIKKETVEVIPVFTLNILKHNLFPKGDLLDLDITGYLLHGNENLSNLSDNFSLTKNYWGFGGDIAYYYPLGGSVFNSPLLLGGHVKGMFSNFEKGITGFGLSISNTSQNELLPLSFLLGGGFGIPSRKVFTMEGETLSKTTKTDLNISNRKFFPYLKVIVGGRFIPFPKSPLTLNLRVEGSSYIGYPSSSLIWHGSVTSPLTQNFLLTVGGGGGFFKNNEEQKKVLGIYFNVDIYKIGVFGRVANQGIEVGVHYTF
ncbi:MAG: hypothetical protein QXG16_03370 [Candidatus Anstonellaceae archaeon]